MGETAFILGFVVQLAVPVRTLSWSENVDLQAYGTTEDWEKTKIEKTTLGFT